MEELEKIFEGIWKFTKEIFSLGWNFIKNFVKFLAKVPGWLLTNLPHLFVIGLVGFIMFLLYQALKSENS